MRAAMVRTDQSNFAAFGSSLLHKFDGSPFAVFAPIKFVQSMIPKSGTGLRKSSCSNKS
jgi:hypothetical protein